MFLLDEMAEQNLSLEEYQQSMRQNQNSATALVAASNRPRTLSVSTSMNLTPPPAATAQHRASTTVFMPVNLNANDAVNNKKQNCAIARELSDLVVYCQSVKFKGFYKARPSADSPAVNSTPVRKTGLRSLESTPSSSSASLNSISTAQLVNGGSAGAKSAVSVDLTSPIYQCASIHESRAKTLCRKQPQRMLEHTQGK